MNVIFGSECCFLGYQISCNAFYWSTLNRCTLNDDNNNDEISTLIIILDNYFMIYHHERSLRMAKVLNLLSYLRLIDRKKKIFLKQI